MASGEMSDDEFRGFLTDTLRNARDVSRDGSLCYVCMDWRGIETLLGAGRGLFTELHEPDLLGQIERRHGRLLSLTTRTDRCV